ncbi:UDP-2,3-diacylglucosamine diphosphatase [Marinilongibacter aquaticus]|uniref:UDP-2,3-diacylglucosamine diphosphatase n=1 Tax=Marinilongibacter aquaticus TaxID=2975157 RepID=UPI0021BD2D22|nr:UDP-2,3-diacylglucosamine diphosphatase [Marinilongibacter aquaticus]UBM60354.1 UDP-2,3-diacylglucosamine diphosphatase [Marinilongibacter aquaticus]
MRTVLNLQPGKKVYFASDFHLGAPTHAESLLRERQVVSWLDTIKADAQVVFLMGDLFDFWFEYKMVVPKGYTRFFGKLAELADMGIALKIFVGNHDLWMKDYFTQEFGAEIITDPQQYEIAGHSLYLAHGDGLGPGDYAYKKLKGVFQNKFCQFLFGRIVHPNLGMKLGNAWSLNSWKKNRANDRVHAFQNGDKELLYSYCKELQAKGEFYDYYVFGHRHCVLDLPLERGARYINIGDWIIFYSYAVLDESGLELKKWNERILG